MIIGIDIGGTTIKFGLFESDELVKKIELPTTDILSVLKEGVRIISDGVEISGIGLTVPGPCKDNFMFFAPNISWGNFNVQELLRKELGYDNIEVMNDANAAAFGEFKVTGKYDSAVMITLGTGVGGGIVADGNVLEGSSGFAGEIGHIQLDTEYKFTCGCGGTGCVETLASATGLKRLYKHYTNTELEAKDIFDLAKQGNEDAVKVTSIYMAEIAKLCHLMSVTVNPEIFIIGGGVSKAGEFLIEGIKKHFLEINSFKKLNEQKFMLAELGNDAGMYGAYYLVK